jgi:hypothetical protein
MSATVEPNYPKIDKWKYFDLIGYETHHSEVKRFHNSEARIKVASAPRRSTKSYASAKDVQPILLLPNTRVWIVGPSYGLAEKEFRYIHEDMVINRNKLGLPKPKVCMTNPRSGQLFIKFAWGAIVEGKTADRPESLLGEAVDAVIYSEAAQLPRGIRERYVQPTVITRKGIEIIPTTPDQKAEWVHELVEIGQQEDYPEIESFHWDVRANPAYDMAEFEQARKFYGENHPVFREQYLGEWVFYGGMVFPDYNPDLHVIDPFDIPKSWPVIRAIDFGHRDPFVCLWAAVGPEGELYFFKEYYNREGKGMPYHASRIKNESKSYRISMTVGDPQAKQSIDDLCYEGIPCISANNDRPAGRMRVMEYLMPTDDGPAPFPLKNLPASLARAKWPRMYITKDCKELIRELKFYRWKEAQSKEGDKEKTEGEDHACDAMRYLVMTRPSPVKMQRKIKSNSFAGWLHKMRSQRDLSIHIGA